jgi:hypothetical protein
MFSSSQKYCSIFEGSIYIYEHILRLLILVYPEKRNGFWIELIDDHATVHVGSVLWGSKPEHLLLYLDQIEG